VVAGPETIDGLGYVLGQLAQRDVCGDEGLRVSGRVVGDVAG
jgi:hypothetical protein